MTMNTVYGLLALGALAVFVIVAFRQGVKVPPSGRDPNDFVLSPPRT
jgi:hypothetical protein